VSDSASKIRPAADSGFRKRGAAAYSLKLKSGELPIVKQRTLIGRGSTCDVVLDSALVSRQHAAILYRDDVLYLEDLGSRNGARINSTEVRGTVELKIGDLIELGDQSMQVVERALPSDAVTAERRAAMTLSFESARNEQRSDNDSSSAAARRAGTIELLGGVVEKALGLGKTDEAEHLLSSHLSVLIGEAESGTRVSNDAAAAAARTAVRLAAATGKPVWMNQAIRLYTALGQPMPLPIVDELFALLRRVRGIDKAQLRKYVSTLRSRAERFNASERFALQRIEGLERIAGL
jgi:pSer/pThr/pTyr-binding forkhead associated (FHA) protein